MTCGVQRNVIPGYGRRICGERLGRENDGRRKVRKGTLFRARKEFFFFLALVADSAVGEGMSRLVDTPMGRLFRKGNGTVVGRALRADRVSSSMGAATLGAVCLWER